MGAGCGGSAHAERSGPRRRSSRPLLALAALPLVLAACSPDGVRLAVAPSLSAQDAFPVGVSDIARLPGARVEIAAEWLPGGTLHVVNRLHRGDRDETELWFSTGRGGEPVVRAAFRTTRGGPHGDTSEALDVHGTVSVDRPLAADLLERRITAPLTVSYDLRGSQWGADQRTRWKLHLPATPGSRK